MSIYPTSEKPIKAVEITKDISVGLFADGKVMTMIHGKPFVQCRGAIIVEPDADAINERLRGYRNMDEFLAGRSVAEQRLDERISSRHSEIDPETELFVHASSIQGWVDSGYDIDVIDTRIAFPILLELSKHEQYARKALFFEVERRWNEGSKESKEALAMTPAPRLVIEAMKFRKRLIEDPSMQWITTRFQSADYISNPFIDDDKKAAILLKSGIVSALKYYASQYEKYPDAYYGRNTRLLEDLSTASWKSDEEIAKLLLKRYKEVDGKSILDALEVTRHRMDIFSWVDLLILKSLYPGEDTIDYYDLVDESAVEVYTTSNDARVKQAIMSEDYSTDTIMAFVDNGASISDLSGENVENILDFIYDHILEEEGVVYLGTEVIAFFKEHAAELAKRADPRKFGFIEEAFKMSEGGKRRA